MKFSYRKHGVLYLGWGRAGNNLVPKDRLRTDRLESNLNKKVWEGHGVIMVTSWLRPRATNTSVWHP